MSNEDLIVQNQERNQNTGDGSSLTLKEVLDSDGHIIDLNHSPKSK